MCYTLCGNSRYTTLLLHLKLGLLEKLVPEMTKKIKDNSGIFFGKLIEIYVQSDETQSYDGKRIGCRGAPPFGVIHRQLVHEITEKQRTTV